MIDIPALIKKHEGKSVHGDRHIPYQDTVGKWTIGYGRNISDRGISEAEAELFLANDIKIVEAELDQALPWWRNKPAHVQAVLLDLGFNLGVLTPETAKLLTFVKTLELINNDRFEAAADNLTRTKWYKQVGSRGSDIERLLRTGSL